MSRRNWRLSIYLFVALVSLLLIIKGHSLPERKSVAFMRYTTGTILFKITGSDGRDGVYRIIDGESRVSVKNMTYEDASDAMKSYIAGNYQLANGDVIEFSGKIIQTSAVRMTAVELILLGVPLDPFRMTAADWSSLPGIGPSLAGEIVSYCQKNGGIASLEELAAVPGIGEGTLKKIRSFFR